jgi:hypothetical protein
LPNLRELVLQLTSFSINEKDSKNCPLLEKITLTITEERTRVRLDGKEMEFANNLKKINLDNAVFWTHSESKT